MSSSGQLRLVDPDANRDSLPFERRLHHRRSIHGRVTAIRTPRPGQEQPAMICPLTLCDMSDTGLGAISQEPLEPGSTITVLFPPHGPEKGFDLYGKVVRCNTRSEGHEIGIQFSRQVAAA